jgi:hypothetical protein
MATEATDSGQAPNQPFGRLAIALGVLGCLTGTGVSALIAVALGLKLRHEYQRDPGRYRRDLGTPALVIGAIGVLIFAVGLTVTIMVRAGK